MSPPETPLTIADKIGSFQLSSLDPASAAFTPLLYRLREETFPGRTTQIRHGSYLRRFTKGPPLDIDLATDNKPNANLESIMREFGWTGCVVVRNGAIRVEEYRHGNSPASRNDIQSVTKSFMTTILGIAQQQGKLSVNDTVSSHIEELKDTAWKDVPLLALANMSAGVVEISEEARPPDVPNPMYATDLYPQSDTNAVLNWLRTFRKVAEPWEEFHYYNPNFYVLSLAISRATQVPLEEYISSQIWEPAGMQYDAYMRTTGAGQIDGHGGLSVALTDIARFGCFILDALKGEGQGPVLPKGWFQNISEARTSEGPRAAGANDIIPTFGYETGWWTPAKGAEGGPLRENGTFAGFGMYGQSLYVIPKLDTVIAVQSGYPEHSWEIFAGNIDFATAVVKALQKEDKQT
ncbi:hypothetical protein CDV31_002983 [Fusarium ambrosium]|uniref:Beta-lactamase-related domain-containing protein n=1 Tax=Fusarium ambrosium TaxID=131363 RepID=A0A428UVI0_9HYPO|nr:hypothetical protein CDV31_002983 [Fusarium ambrosium]